LSRNQAESYANSSRPFSILPKQPKCLASAASLKGVLKYEEAKMSNGYARYTRLSQDEDELEPQLELREQATLTTRSEPKGVYFSNGNEPKRRIDYVLVYETKQNDDSDSSKERSLQSLRKTFEDNLRKEKLLIEYDELSLPQVRVRCTA